FDEGGRLRVTGRSQGRLFRALGSRAAYVEFVEGDLTSPDFCLRACQGMSAVFNLAGFVAGVGYNIEHPGSIFTTNALIGMNVLEAAAKASVERFLCLSSACVYRRQCTIPTPEIEGFLDDP